MTYRQLRILEESKLHVWSFKDVMLGVQTADLSKELPADLKELICNMSIGFAVYCRAAREAEFDKNGIHNRRDVKCLVQRFSSVPPKRENWTCWPCLDFLKKFKPDVWKQRTGLKIEYNLSEKPLPFRKEHSLMKIKNFEVSGKDAKLSKDGKNVVVVKFRLGDIHIMQDATSNTFCS